MDYLGALIKDVIGEAEDRDKNHQVTLNQVRDSQSLVTKTPWLRPEMGSSGSGRVWGYDPTRSTKRSRLPGPMRSEAERV